MRLDRGTLGLSMLLTLGSTACGGLESSPAGGRDPFAGDASATVPADATTDASGPDAATDAAGLDTAVDGSDPGRVSIHRLSQAEYANTVRDLLGVSASPDVAGFPTDPTAEGFDNNADMLSVSPDAFVWYFQSAHIVAAQAFADPAQRARIVTCTPLGAVDATCAQGIIRAFGLRAWRRPLSDDEVSALVQLASANSADPLPNVGPATAPDLLAQSQFAASIEEVVVAMLSSESFLYRIEFDPDPNSATVHALSPYELASRLSYLLWSTMPDDELFAHAAAGDLAKDDVLAAEVTRMLSDSRSDQFVHNFGGQWLGFRGLATHKVDTTVFPNWSRALGDAMAQEAFLYFSLFRDPARKLTDLLTVNVNFVDGPLARLYGVISMDAGATTLTHVDDATTVRKGYLGLAAFLTATSWPNQTSPSIRGQWVNNRLLCQLIPDDPSQPPQGTVPPRQRLQPTDNTPGCGVCHQRIDPLGFGLENFDAIGAYRSQYPSGDAIDPSGVIPNGIAFGGLLDLADKLAQDPRVLDCIVRKTLVYALGRSLGVTDDGYVTPLRDAWSAGGPSLPALLLGVVRNDTFRLRRGEAP